MAVENSVPMARAMKKLSAYFMKRVFIRGTMSTPVREKRLITVTLKKEKPHTGVGATGWMGEEGVTLKQAAMHNDWVTHPESYSMQHKNKV